VAGQCPVDFYGRTGGVVPLPDEVLAAIAKLDQATLPAARVPLLNS
jgi:2-oxoglutarate ferredoxin oxidoreductase subunit alpha